VRIARFTGGVFWPRNLDGTLGRALGALSLLALIRYSFHFGLSAAASEVFRFYHDVLRVLLGWLDPFLREWIAAIMVVIKLHFKFNEYWRDVFVVMQLLFVRDAGVAFADKRYTVGSVRLVVGFVVSAVTSVLAAIQLTQASNVLQNLVFATLPTCGIYAYDLVMYCHSATSQLEYLNKTEGQPGRSRGDFLKRALVRGTTRFALGISVSYLSFLFPVVRQAPAPAGGLIAIGLATVANASYWLWRGGKFAAAESRKGEEWIEAFRRSEAGRFGAAVTGVIIWALVFAAINAGMRQLGL
jgi:hypothetical protein